MSDQHEEANMGSTIWQSQPAQTPRISLEFLHYQSGRLRRSLKNELNMFYVVTTAAVGSFLVLIYKHWAANEWSAINAIIDASMLLFGIALIFLAFHLRRNLLIKKIEKDVDVTVGLTSYRSEIERLIQLAYREWYVLLYFVPGYLTLLVGGLIFDQRPGKVWRYGFTVVGGVVSACFGLWAGRKRSKCLQRELEAIASLK